MRRKYSVGMVLGLCLAIIIVVVAFISLLPTSNQVSCERHVPPDVLRVPEMMSVSVMESPSGNFVVQSRGGSHGCRSMQLWACDGSGLVVETPRGFCGMGDNTGQTPIRWTQSDELVLEERFTFNNRPNGIYLLEPNESTWTLLYANPQTYNWLWYSDQLPDIDTLLTSVPTSP